MKRRWWLAGIGVLALLMCPVLLSQAPTQVVERFCEMDAQGNQLTEDGWQKMKALFADPGPTAANKIIVVKDYVVSPPAISGNKAELYAEYIYLGEIDRQSGRFSPLPYFKARSGFDLVRSDDHSGWKISVTPPESHISVETALSYMTDLRDHATISTAKKNAEKAIAALRRLKSAN